MAIVKHVLKRKTANGYDTYHLQSQASLILAESSQNIILLTIQGVTQTLNT